jgi:mannose-6-phosphate isomerase-like protein (cupin superfamily)
MTDRTPRIVRAGERRPSELRYGRGSVEKIVDGAIGAEGVDLHLNRIRVGSVPGPYHLHTEAENVYLVLAGDVVVRIDGVDHRLGAGDAAFIPPGVPHSASNVGTTDAEHIDIYAPAAVDFVEVEQAGDPAPSEERRPIDG